jgi:hypothetical protein
LLKKRSWKLDVFPLGHFGCDITNDCKVWNF